MVGGLQPPSLEEEEAQAKAEGQGVIFVLDDAQLETAQIGKVIALGHFTSHSYTSA
jgi:rRNA small subunit pseudouridine methyltransferase Nep1